MLGSYWPYITPEYMYHEMTWNEIGAAMDWIYRYEVNERQCRGSVKINDWIYKGRDTLASDLKKISAELRKGGLK